MTTRNPLPGCLPLLAGVIGFTVAITVPLACASTPAHACTPEAREALTVLYERAAVQVVESGGCDDAPNAEECEPMKALLVHMRLAQKAMCGQ